jgi:hypothetical protein
MQTRAIFDCNCNVKCRTKPATAAIPMMSFDNHGSFEVRDHLTTGEVVSRGYGAIPFSLNTSKLFCAVARLSKAHANVAPSASPKHVP